MSNDFRCIYTFSATVNFIKFILVKTYLLRQIKVYYSGEKQTG
jgi:hypothetical protein